MSLYLTLIITFGGSVAALFNPFYGLLAYVALAVLKPDALWWYNVPQWNYSRVLAICMLAGWVLRGFGSWKFGKGAYVTWCLILHVAWIGIGMVFVAPDWDRAFYEFEILVKIMLPFLVAMTTIRSVQQVKWLAIVIAVSMAIVAFELNHKYYVWNFRFNESIVLGLDNNVLGLMLASGLGLTVGLIMGLSNWIWKGFFGFSALLLINAICFSDSRGTMLAGLITGLATFVLMPKRMIHFVVLTAVVAAGVRLAGPQTIERFSTIFVDSEERDASAESRTILWSQAASTMLNHPLTGIGPGGWYEEAAKFGWPPGKQVHSTWLQNGAEGGLFGFVVYIAFYTICIAQMTRMAWVPTADERLRPFLITASRTVAASLIGFIVANQFVTAWAVEMPYYLCLIGALVMKLRDSTPPETEPERLLTEEEWDEPEVSYVEEPLSV